MTKRRKQRCPHGLIIVRNKDKRNPYYWRNSPGEQDKFSKDPDFCCACCNTDFEDERPEWATDADYFLCAECAGKAKVEPGQHYSRRKLGKAFVYYGVGSFKELTPPKEV